MPLLLGCLPYLLDCDDDGPPALRVSQNACRSTTTLSTIALLEDDYIHTQIRDNHRLFGIEEEKRDGGRGSGLGRSVYMYARRPLASVLAISLRRNELA